jgi:hypothetical protein
MERPETPYRVVYAGQSLQQLNDLIEQAVRLGTLTDLEDTVKKIQQRLAAAPLEWGDPLYHLRYLGLFLFRGTLAPLNVIYAVDEQRKLVYLTQIWPMPGRGYTQET